MPDELHLLSPAGFAAAGIAAGLKPSGKHDLGLLVCTGHQPARAVAAFSRNRIVSPTITVGREHLADGKLRAVVVNSGNANACTGAGGEADARQTCDLVAELVGCDATDVLPSSTGIIGHRLDMPTLLYGVRTAHDQLGTSADHAADFGRAILTTDLVTKSAATTFESATIAGCCKGSGMIGPMLGVDGAGGEKQATMLAYVTTDVAIELDLLRRCVDQAAQRTFNRTTVDGHASTNDTLLVMASGQSDVRITDNNVDAFTESLTGLCDQLAYQIAGDGEGATKVVTVRVTGAATEAAAAAMAMGIAESPLVKTALHGNDPNWGRVVSIAGKIAARDGIALDPDKCTLSICGFDVYAGGIPLDFDAAAASKALAAKEVELVFDAGVGQASAHVYTCDLSREYITINAD
ncbi:MAG: bifunctional glutamate N-acetyltransferase/amino-acid acetyltransferase ArgJ, partial [Planctomycetota bacterium]